MNFWKLNPFAWWRQHQRDIDHEILFASVIKMADSDKQAARAILLHISIDSAWNCDVQEFSKRDGELILSASQQIT